jgi:hypothetical protein
MKRRIPAQIPGVYLVIGERRVIYAGRSDWCLRTRLMNHEHLPYARVIAWRRCRSRAAAYQLESLCYARVQGGRC